MGKYDKYIINQLYKRDRLPGPTPENRDILAQEGKRMSMEHLLWLDSDVIPGSYYGESTWLWPSNYPNQGDPKELADRGMANMKPMFPHAHSFPELLSWWSSDVDDPTTIGSMGMIMGDELIPLDNSWVAYIPAGMMHMPTRGTGNKVSQVPGVHWTSGPGTYTRDKDGKEVEDEQKEAQTEVKTVPGKQENLKYFVLGGQQKVEDIKKPDYMTPIAPKYYRHMAYIDEKVIPGCEFGCDTFFLMPGITPGPDIKVIEKSTLPYGRQITFTANNYEHLKELGAECEFWIGGEKHIVAMAFGAYVPPDVEVGPVILKNITRQIFFMMSRPVGEGIKKYPGGKLV